MELKNIEKLIKEIELTYRPSWHEYFMLIAELVALRSTCYNRKVGAVIVKDKRIIATGYNGAPSGISSCFEMGYCLKDEKIEDFIQKFKERKDNIEDLVKYKAVRYCIAQHAEENAIAQAARFGIPLENAEMYVTLEPCERCTKLIISSKIRKVYIGRRYNDSSRYEEDLDRIMLKKKLESSTSFEFVKVRDKIRALVAYELFNADVSRNRKGKKK